MAGNQKETVNLAVLRLGQSMLANGLSFRQVSDALNEDYHALYRTMRRRGMLEPRRTHKRLSEKTESEIRRMLVETNMSRREIARALGISKGSVDIRAKQMRRQLVDEGSDVLFREESWVCPVHGRVQFRPCVACASQIT